jgi:hypothetical protein
VHFQMLVRTVHNTWDCHVARNLYMNKGMNNNIPIRQQK